MASDTSSMDGRETARENNKDDSTGHIEAVRAAMSKHSQYTPDTGYQSCDASSLSSSTSLSSCSTPRALFDHREESRTGDSIDSSSSSSSSDGLFDLLHASLSTSSQSSSRPSPASTWRGSQSTRATASNCSTESRNDGTSYSSSISSSGSTSPASPKNSRSRRQSSTIAIVAAPFTPSTQAFTSAIHKTSQVATSLITIHQALSLSLYILVTLIATITLLSILVAGYGLTLADDIKYKIGKLGKKADQKRRELLFDLEEWLRITNENLKKREAALEPRHSYNQRRRRSSYPHSTRNHKADSRRFENRSEDTFKTLQVRLHSLLQPSLVCSRRRQFTLTLRSSTH